MPHAFFNVRYLLCAMVAGLLIPALGHFALAQEITDRIQKQYESTNSFTCSFEQKLTNAASGETQHREGTIAFRQPQLIRWETTEPEKELLLVGEDAVWNYFAEEEVAYKYRVDQIFQSKTMLRFISGAANLKEDFKVVNQGTDSGWEKIKLIPKKPEPGLVLAYLWIESESALLRQVLIVDFFGNGNQLTLNDLILNVELDASQFTFVPPEGVEVLDNTVTGAGS